MDKSFENISFREDILLDIRKIQSMDFLKSLLDSLPFIIAILNQERRVVYANEYAIESLGYEKMHDALGTFPGNLLHCTNANGYPHGCGTTQKCRVCSVLSTVNDSREKNERLTREARLITQIDEKTYSFNLLITSSPFVVEDQLYQMVIVNDISNENRRRMLERIFFHDVINKSGSLMGLIRLLQSSKDPIHQNDLINDLGNIATDLTEEILAQRDLVAAENGELKIKLTKINSMQLLEKVLDQIKYHNVAHKRQVILDGRSETCEFDSDIVLINRVITNMVKNALEAINENEQVTLSCFRKNNNVLFRVHNPGYIQKDVQLQIFMRSFSTKSNNRGLGTYSMKLISEQYLHGEVYFETSKANGTSFYLNIPLEIKS
ncbi:MAG: GHKL domain-containing protein [Bacteroidales bacterium]|nr:GHKL domain-containing protein [Bacteroidales bacterium]